MISAILAAILTARLDNGMTVVVDRDPRVSDAAVELWFRAGSADEPPGRHGIAHLFEHDFPSASRFTANPENANAIARDRLDSNGSTGVEYTNFFLRVPATSVELAIALFADRMSAPADAITDATLAGNRDIVLAEFRNAEGRSWNPELTNPIRAALFGAHPYGHAVLGTAEEVEAVTTDEMRRWFRAHYGAANAMLVVAGNVDPAAIVALAKKHFGSIPAGVSKPLTVPEVAPSPDRKTIALNVLRATASTILAWRMAGWDDPQRQDALIAIELLRDRLRSKFHCDVADGDGFTASAGGEASLVIACAKPDDVVKTLDDFLASTPEIAPARDTRLAAFLESLDALGWRSSRTELEGEGVWFAGDADAYRLQLEAIRDADAASVMTAARTWLRHPLIVEVRPAVVSDAPDRSATIPVAVPQPPEARPVVASAGVITATATTPIVTGRIVYPDRVEPFAAVPSRAIQELQSRLHRKPIAVVLVGDVDRNAVARLLQTAPAAGTADASTTRANVRVVAQFGDADPARVSIAASLLRSRLNARIRETERWSYNVDVHVEGRDAIAIETQVSDDVVEKATAVISEAVETLPHEALTAADAARAAGSELRRLTMLASTDGDLADALVDVVRSGQTYDQYVRSHHDLYQSLKEGASLGLPAPTVRTPRPPS